MAKLTKSGIKFLDFFAKHSDLDGDLLYTEATKEFNSRTLKKLVDDGYIVTLTRGATPDGTGATKYINLMKPAEDAIAARKAYDEADQQQKRAVATITTEGVAVSKAEYLSFDNPPVAEEVSIIIIGCGSKKLDKGAMAKELYTSSLFKRRREYAELTGKPWFILSANHGLMHPSLIIGPYELHIKHFAEDQLAEWKEKVADALWGRIEALGAKEGSSVKIELHMGDEYSKELIDAAISFENVSYVFEKPAVGGIPKQQKWLSSKIAELGGEAPKKKRGRKKKASDEVAVDSRGVVTVTFSKTTADLFSHLSKEAGDEVFEMVDQAGEVKADGSYQGRFEIGRNRDAFYKIESDKGFQESIEMRPLCDAVFEALAKPIMIRVSGELPRAALDRVLSQTNPATDALFKTIDRLNGAADGYWGEFVFEKHLPELTTFAAALSKLDEPLLQNVREALIAFGFDAKLDLEETPVAEAPAAALAKLPADIRCGADLAIRGLSMMFNDKAQAPQEFLEMETVLEALVDALDRARDIAKGNPNKKAREELSEAMELLYTAAEHVGEVESWFQLIEGDFEDATDGDACAHCGQRVLEFIVKRGDVIECADLEACREQRICQHCGEDNKVFNEFSKTWLCNNSKCINYKNAASADSVKLSDEEGKVDLGDFLEGGKGKVKFNYYSFAPLFTIRAARQGSGFEVCKESKILAMSPTMAMAKLVLSKAAISSGDYSKPDLCDECEKPMAESEKVAIASDEGSKVICDSCDEGSMIAIESEVVDYRNNEERSAPPPSFDELLKSSFEKASSGGAALATIKKPKTKTKEKVDKLADVAAQALADLFDNLDESDKRKWVLKTISNQFKAMFNK